MAGSGRNAQVDVVIERLSEEFAGVFSPGTVRRYVEESFEDWSHARSPSTCRC